ncbi:MAG: hypothetical protein RSB52_09035, partial [Acidaminococcaceae bacterium]
TELTVRELEAVSNFCDILYTTGKNSNRLLSMDVSMEDVVAQCVTNFNETIGYQIEDHKVGDVKGAMGKYMSSLMKPEVLLRILGGKDGGFIKYIYNPLFDGNQKESLAKEKEAGVIRDLYNKFYAKKERWEMCNKILPRTLEDGSKLTKENLLCMALNWGNEGNRSRLCVGLGMGETKVFALLQEELTKKDWAFVQALWDHIGQYGDQVNAVVEKQLGVPMHRVKPQKFVITTADNQTAELAGGYYPIRSDPTKSNAAQ